MEALGLSKIFITLTGLNDVTIQTAAFIFNPAWISILHLLSAHIFYHWLEHHSHSGMLQEMHTLSNENAMLWSAMKQISVTHASHTYT